MLRPVVIHRGRKREGKGFSLAELKAVGINKLYAKKLGIPVDERRKTCLENNINMLKELIKK
ncbi:MAG: ribosomal protein L13e [Candidatus Aenigmatarchaeota archaeon]